MAKLIIQCDGCDIDFPREKSLIAKNKRIGRKNFHSNSCATTYRHSQTPKSEIKKYPVTCAACGETCYKEKQYITRNWKTGRRNVCDDVCKGLLLNKTLDAMPELRAPGTGRPIAAPVILVDVTCAACSTVFQRDQRLVLKNKINGRDNVCNSSCGSKLINIKNPHIAENFFKGLDAARKKPEYWHSCLYPINRWKYVNLEEYLQQKHIKYKFEYALISPKRAFVYDLYLPHLKLLIEFDEPHHDFNSNMESDAVKDAYGRSCGYEVQRIKVKKKTVFSIDLIKPFLKGK